MKKLLSALAIVSVLPFFSACTKSVERAQRDVDRAHDRAVTDVQQKQQDLQETKREAADRIARQERRVEDAARRGNEDVINKERDLQDAQRADVRDHRSTDLPATTPTIRDNANLNTVPPVNNRGGVDVNINRGPGGVQVDVNRNP